MKSSNFAIGGVIEREQPPITVERYEFDLAMPIKKILSSEEILFEEIKKTLNDPKNNPKKFVSLATFDGITISKTLNGGI